MSIRTRTQQKIDYLTSEYQQDRYRSFLRQFKRNSKGIFGIVVIVLVLTVALFESFLMLHDPYSVNLAQTIEPPSSTHPLGTDQQGRDVFSRVIAGTRISIYVGTLSVLISTVFGVPIGLIGGYYQGYIDELLMRLMDAMMAFPAILLALVLLVVLGQSLNNVVLALGFVYTPYFARIARSATLETANNEYVDAARALGQSDFSILFREILPNITAPVFVQASITFAFAILAEAGLSFLGMGTQPPEPSWGLMVSEARGDLSRAPWMMLFPGLAICIVVIGLNMFGDALRDILDPEVKTTDETE